MKKTIFVLLLVFVFYQTFSQKSKIVGQYYLAKTSQTPKDWISAKGTAIIKKNEDGTITIIGNFLIKTTETVTLKANFSAENCIIPLDRNIETYLTTGDVAVIRSEENGGQRHFSIVSIKVDFEKQEIKISETDPSDWRLTSWQLWKKNVSNSTIPK